MIGYYAHHVGHGHVETARCIAARLTGEVTVLSLLPRPPGWPGGWLTLPRDDGEARELEPTANGQLHWAPLGHRGLRDRMAVIAQWIQDVAPSVFVVDVSAEVTALVRLMGIPVVTIVLPGRRRDPAHRLCYTLAETILAPWPASVSGILLDGDSSWGNKIRHVGAFSRFDDRIPQPLPLAVSMRRSCCWVAGDPASPARTSTKRRPLLPAGGGPLWAARPAGGQKIHGRHCAEPTW